MPALTPPPAPLRLASRPALALALAAGVGIVLAEAWPGLPPEAWLGGGALLALACGAYAWSARGRLVSLRPLALSAAVLASAGALGAAGAEASRTLAPDHVAHVALQAEAAERRARLTPGLAEDRTPLVLEGRVLDVPVATRAGVRFTLRADTASRGSQGGRVRGDVQVTLAGPLPGDGPLVYPALRLGDRVRVTGTPQPPPLRRNPAAMDYGAWLARRGVHATLRVRDPAEAEFLAPATRPSDRLAVAVQRHVRQAVALHLGRDDARAVVLALLLADRSRIAPETRAQFAETGLMHLLAVSGLHVLLVGLALYGLLKPLLGRLGVGHRRAEWLRAGLTLGLLGLYVLVTGATVSVVRAFVMTAVMVGGRAGERRADTLNSLGVAALVLLALRPLALFEVGFQLSFAAVAALATLTPRMLARVPEAALRHPATGWALQSGAASLAATLGTAPVLMAHFGAVPLAGLVLNLPAIPLTGVVLGSGLGAALCHGWAGPIAGLFGALADASGWALLAVSRWGAEGLGAWALRGFVTDPLVLGALVLALLAGALGGRRQARVGAGLGALACLALAVWAGVLRGDARPRLDAVFLDVGQGDATLLRLPNGAHVLVDAGMKDPYTDQGARTVVPHLRRHGVRRLDAVVLTHPHADHVGGLAAVLRAVPVGLVIHSGHPVDSAVWAEGLGVADSLGVPQRHVQAGDTLALDPAVRLRVLGPAGVPAEGDNLNEASVVVLVEMGRTRMLLTGDAEGGAEASLAARFGPLLRADVVKVGHHGSRTSSTPPLVMAASSGLSLKWAVVSVARRNRYNLPNAEPLLRWAAAGAEVLQTADEGAVWLRSDGRRVWRVRWR